MKESSRTRSSISVQEHPEISWIASIRAQEQAYRERQRQRHARRRNRKRLGTRQHSYPSTNTGMSPRSSSPREWRTPRGRSFSSISSVCEEELALNPSELSYWLRSVDEVFAQSDPCSSTTRHPLPISPRIHPRRFRSVEETWNREHVSSVTCDPFVTVSRLWRSLCTRPRIIARLCDFLFVHDALELARTNHLCERGLPRIRCLGLLSNPIFPL